MNNLQTFIFATLALDPRKRADVERTFLDRYQRAAAISGADYAEALARAETLHLLIGSEFEFEGASYIKSLLH